MSRFTVRSGGVEEEGLASFPKQFQKDLLIESWALFAVALLFIGARLYARTRKLGLRHLQIDDWLMVTALIWYIILNVTLNLTAQGGGSALALPGEDVMAIPEHALKIREKGAKIGFVAEQAMLNLIWTLKACMLLLYNRLTMGLKQRIGVKILAVYVALGFVACQLTIFTECIPFRKYWQVAPSPSKNCMVYYDYIVVQFIANVSSDLFMLLIPLPIVLSAMVPFKQKAVLFVIFSMGIFVIVSATITKVEYFISIYSADFMFWYVREASVAVYIANLPCIWPLLRETMPVLRSWTPGWLSSGARRYKSKYGNGTSAHMSRGGLTHRTNVTRRSLEEFRKIGDTSANKSAITSNARDLGVLERSIGIMSNKDQDSDTASDELPFHGILMETTIEMSVLSDAGTPIDSPTQGSHKSLKSMEDNEGVQKPHSRV